MRFMHSVAFLLLVAVSLPATSFGQQLANQCKVFLDKPVFTTTTVSSSQATRDSFRLLQCSANWKSASEAQSAGIDVTIPIYDIPVPFNLNWSDQKVEQWKSANCSVQERDNQANLRYYQAVYSVDPVTAKAALECFDKGFKAEVDLSSTSALRCTLTETSAAYVFEARWRRTAGETGPPPTVYEFTTINTSCNGESLAKGQSISEGGTPVLCLVGEKAAAFSLTTDRGGCTASATVRLPKLRLPTAITLTEPMFLIGQEIEFPANARIVTNGFPLSIRAEKLNLLGSVRIQSFQASVPDLQQPGKSAGPISIYADEVVGQGGVSILNAGQPGGPGGVGPQGPPGPPGHPGRSRTTNWKKNCPLPFVCDLIPSGCEGGRKGGTGGPGGPGYPGLPGMPGGAAGEVRLDVPLDMRNMFSVLTNTGLDGQPAHCDGQICGGAGGRGGPGGPGGPGGSGGAGAPGTLYCGGTDGGRQGPEGPTGPQGPNGSNGANATFR